MITLPADVVPASAKASQMEFGVLLRPATGAAVSYIDRPGTRWKADVALPPLRPAVARMVINRLTRAKSEVLRINWPLMGAAQGVPGVPVVNGSGAAGKSLPLRGLTPHVRLLEGYWISIEDADGNRYLHQVDALATADASGMATVTVSPMLRAEFADGGRVLIAAPTIEGLVTSVIEWPATPDRLVPLSFTIEEAQ